MEGLLTSLVYPESAMQSFPKSAEFFELIPNQTGGARQQTSPRLVSRSADAEADVADSFGAEALF